MTGALPRARRPSIAGRRVEIAEAAWRVLARAGYAGATVREIAREAGFSTGVLSHHFSDKRELVLFAYAELLDRQAGRVAVAAERGLEPALAELLPLDDARRLEVITWIVLTTASLGDEELTAECAALCEAARDAMRPVLRELLGGSRTAADDLLIVADGIAFNAVAHPQRFTAARQRSMLRRAIASTESGAAA